MEREIFSIMYLTILVKMERFEKRAQEENVLRMFRSSNRDFVLPIVRNRRFGLTAVQFVASEKLKADQEFMLEAVNLWGAQAFAHASDNLKANQAFMHEVVRMLPRGDSSRARAWAPQMNAQVLRVRPRPSPRLTEVRVTEAEPENRGEKIRSLAEGFFSGKKDSHEHVFDGQNTFSQPVGSQNKLSSSTPPTPRTES